MSNILGKLNLSFATKKFKKKFPFLTDKYLTEFSGQHVKAIQNLRVYKDKGFKELTGYTIERNVVFMPSEVVFTKAGTPRLKLPNGYITASKKYVELTNEPITKRRIAIDGQMQQVRYDVENYITALDGKNVKALSELKVYKDIDFKKTLGEEVQKDYVFKVDAIEVTKGGTPRLKIAKGYVTANQKFVVLTDESVTKKIMIIGGKEHQVRDDIENYITTLENKNVKALSELKVYKDIDFKKALDTKLPKGHVFKADTIEVTKGGTPRLKIAKGYITANKKFVTLTDEKITKKKALINGKEVLVRNDIENYITSINQKFVKALSDLTIYDDLAFKNVTERNIAKGELFKPSQIVVSKGGTPRLKVNGGYVTANKKFVCLSEDNPLVSLVIPIYNVEKYLEECLLSLQNQTYKNIEVILVNDGSPDNSVLIAEKFVAQDQRFKLHTQENAGLSAARNKGIELSTGQYIWFIDSDDVISINAIEVAVNNLLNTGSDFVVGCYRRINSSGAKKAGHWIQEAHNENKNCINLNDYPDILVNATAWSKIINLNYIKNNSLYFPIGVLYEDQLWSAKLYSSAHSFNVLKDVIYDWRVRDDNSSITQQSKNVDNLDAILKAIQSSLNSFKKSGLFDIANERIIQVLSNNMREYISYLNYTDREYMERLADGLISITQDFPISGWKNIPAHIAAIEWLLIHKDFDKVDQYLKENALNTNNLVASLIGGKLILKVPFYDDSSVNFPNEVLELKENQYNPNIQLRKSYWVNRNELYMEGWSYLPLINPTEVVCPTQVFLVSEENDSDFVRLDVENFEHPQIDRISKHKINDYRKFGFKFKINFEKLNLKAGLNYKLKFVLKIGSIERSEYLSKVAKFTSSGNIATSTLGNGVCVRFIHKAQQPFLINLSEKKVHLSAYDVKNNFDIIRLKSNLDLKKIEFRHLDSLRKDIKSYFFDLDKNQDGFDSKINLHQLPKDVSTHWLVRAIDVNNKSYVIDSNNLMNDQNLNKKVVEKEFFKFFNTEFGNLGLVISHTSLFVDSLKFNKNEIRLNGRLIGPLNDETRVFLSDHRHQIQCKFTLNKGNKFNLIIPFYFKKWDKLNPLPSGRYELNIKSNQTDLKMAFEPSILAEFPAWFNDIAPIVGNLELHPKNKNIVMLVHAAASLNEMGERKKYNYIQSHINSEDVQIDDKSIFFRTFYGESTTCCALGIHRVLRQKKSDFKLYWSVKDSSVQIPEGGIPVIEGSKAWYELYGKAKYILDNTHQPDFFEKKSDQVVIETFHGYPFKMSGIPYWKAHSFSNTRIASFLRRHDQWDYLVSPAPYATPILEEVFPSRTAKMLEIGYPRNDIFFSPDSGMIRDRVRRILGIKSEQKAILYAPTYRDNLTQNEFKAKMVDFFDLEKVTNEISEDTVILVRGHAINARVNERIQFTSSRVIDVTDYPEISELCLASDLAVLDYSSLRFDYALTGKPMLFYVPDLEDYIGDIRGCLVPYDQTAPGPLVKTNDELIYWLNNIDLIQTKYSLDRAQFIEKYMPLEDGRASERFVDEVLI